MDLTCDERLSDSPLVERIWSGHSDNSGPFISIAAVHYNIVFTRHRGKMMVTVRGPEIKATPAYSPPDAEFFGIMFKPGVFMPLLPPQIVLDRRDINLPLASSQTFYLNGSSWQFPDFDNADTFVDWLARDELLHYDPVVGEVLQGKPVDLSLRTVQRRFLQATGLTQSRLDQIERARYATMLLKAGVSILDVVYEAGYSDQPHLTRSLKHYIGQTPAQIADENRTERLSFLFNT
ncbi:MAG: AraC family transcriptional regulator [Chloroflexi bacterium]|nr:AraC family transcriptional regulator [Chloroflexota bacterium]